LQQTSLLESATIEQLGSATSQQLQSAIPELFESATFEQLLVPESSLTA